MPQESLLSIKLPKGLILLGPGSVNKGHFFECLECGKWDVQLGSLGASEHLLVCKVHQAGLCIPIPSEDVVPPPPDPHFTHNLSCHVQKPMEPLSS